MAIMIDLKKIEHMDTYKEMGKRFSISVIKELVEALEKAGAPVMAGTLSSTVLLTDIQV